MPPGHTRTVHTAMRAPSPPPCDSSTSRKRLQSDVITTAALRTVAASRSRRSLGAGAGRTQPLAQARARPASRVPRASRDQTHARAPQSRTEHEPDADVSEASVTARAKRVVVDPYLGTNQWPPPGTERLSLRTDLADVLLQPVPRLRLHVALPPLGLPFRLARRHARADLRWPTARPSPDPRTANPDWD